MRKKLSLILVISFLLQTIIPGLSMGGETASLLHPNMNYVDVENHWAREAIYEATGLGYISGVGRGRYNPNNNINFGEALAIVLRVGNVESLAQKNYPNDWVRGVYAVGIDRGLIDDIEDIETAALVPNPKKNVSREEFAYLLGNILLEEPPYGAEMNKIKGFSDYNRIEEKNRPYVELLLQKGYMSGRQGNKFDPKTSITRGEVAQVVANSLDDLLRLRDIKRIQGVVTDKTANRLNIYNTDASSNLLPFLESDGNMFPVQKNGRMYKSDILDLEDEIVYYLDRYGKPIYGRVLPENFGAIEGTIEDIDFNNRKIVLLDFNNYKHEFKLDSDINMKDLYFGQELAVDYKGGVVSKISYIENEDPERDGYISPGSRYKKGTVLFVDQEHIEIKTKDGREKYTIDPYFTSLYKKGKNAELFQVKEGDRVLLTFDDIYTTNVAEIKIEDEEKHIEGIIRGSVELVDERNKEILIKNPSGYKHGKWSPINRNLKVKIGTGTIYDGGRQISLANLSKKKGQEAYIAYEAAYGNMTLSKMVLKSGPAMEYESKLQDIDYGMEQIVLDTNSIGIHDGTIVIKDNRLVDTLNLDIDQDLFLVADYKNGNKGASFISIEGTSPLDSRVDGNSIMVYRGKIEDIMDYKLVIGNNSFVDKTILNSNGFTVNREPEDLIYTEDTRIYDSELKKEIPVKAFKDSKYIDLIDIKDKELRDRVAGNYYKNKPVYATVKEIAGEKQILGLNLVPNERPSYNINVQDNYMATGQIVSVNQGGYSIELDSVMNLNNLSKKWERGPKEKINLSQTMIIQNDMPLSPDEIYKIRPGSKGYLVRKKDKAPGKTYILIIED